MPDRSSTAEPTRQAPVTTATTPTTASDPPTPPSAPTSTGGTEPSTSSKAPAGCDRRALATVNAAVVANAASARTGPTPSSNRAQPSPAARVGDGLRDEEQRDQRARDRADPHPDALQAPGPVRPVRLERHQHDGDHAEHDQPHDCVPHGASRKAERSRLDVITSPVNSAGGQPPRDPCPHAGCRATKIRSRPAVSGRTSTSTSPAAIASPAAAAP